MVEKKNEMTIPITAMSTTTTRVNRTGAWKYYEPYYENLTPPCVNRCLNHNDIVELMILVHDGKFDEAGRYLLTFNPFPACLGRVCPHPCEQPCNRKAMGGGVRIQAIERFLGDYVLEKGILPEPAEPTGIRIAIVGAGPAGLSAGYFLRLAGHDVTIYEKEDRAGGLMWSGIPPYRLDRNILRKEVERLEKLGVKFVYNFTLGKDATLEDLRKQYERVILAIGKGKSRQLNIPGEDHPHVYDGIHFLKSVLKGDRPDPGKRIAVIGGGNTAMDCARVALRLGSEVVVVYRRSEREMPAFKDEVREAKEEGIQFQFLTQPIRVLTDGDRVVGIECIRMKLGERDASGRARPVPIEGSEFVIEVDGVIKALGEMVDPESIQPLSKIEVNEQYRTEFEDVFAVGDCTGTSGTVGEAIRMGREVAEMVHRELSTTPFPYTDPLKRRGVKEEIAKFKMFNRSYFDVLKPVEIEERPPEERVHDFEEMVHTLTPEEAQYEAMRCFKCGTCNLCGNCEFFCPDGAIQLNEDGTKYVILYDYCKGCGVCVEECPRGAIHFRPVETTAQWDGGQS